MKFGNLVKIFFRPNLAVKGLNNEISLKQNSELDRFFVSRDWLRGHLHKN